VLVNINEAFPSKYLKAHELHGSTPTVTIERVVLEQVRGRSGTDPRVVVYFRGKTKGLLLNKTMALSVRQIAKSAETDTWAGVAIALYATTAVFGAETHDVIRIRAPHVVAPAASLQTNAATQSRPAATGNHPVGYVEWFGALRQAAMLGTPTLEAAWLEAPKAFRQHLATVTPGAQNELKLIAGRLAGAGRSS
jgi:hypothetical protein